MLLSVDVRELYLRVLAAAPDLPRFYEPGGTDQEYDAHDPGNLE
jgi:hypothetical protein